jgi:Fe-S oxidoreductase
MAPVSDYMMEADTLMGIAAVFRATGDKWTIGTKNYDAINYGLFYSDHVMEEVVTRIKSDADRLQAKNILVGECGHASRTAKYFYPTFCGGREARKVINILEYTWKAWKDGKLKIAPHTITDRVTYHDPCNIARPGWVVDQPRELIKAFCSDFVEMTPNRRQNICCGGGGGSVSIDEIRPYRTSVGGKVKAEQIRATGAKYCIAPCANCKKQLRELMEDQKVDCEIVGLHDLLYKAVIFDESSGAEMETAAVADTAAEVG